jgi:hypothetical protein
MPARTDQIMGVEPGQRPGLVERHSRTGLPDHLVCLEQERWHEGEAKGLGHLEVDDQLELRRLLYWQVARFSTFQELIDKDSSMPDIEQP